MPPRGRDARVHTYQFWTGPLPSVPAQPLQPPRRTNTDPVRPPGRPARAHLMQFYAGSPGIKITILSAFGAAGSATLVLALERGARMTMEWPTSIKTSYSGKEQRESLAAQATRRFDGQAFLVDAGSRDLRGALQRAAATGATFLLALPFEELSLSADSSARTVFVSSALSSDWMISTQRVVLIGTDGSTVFAVIQSATPTTILLDVVPGATGRKGGRILPLVQVLLDPQQQFARYPVTVDLWSVNARAAIFGWCGADSCGVGAMIATYTAGIRIAVAAVADVDLLIWDRTNAIQGTAGEAMNSRGEVVDLGGVPTGAGSALVPDWQRSLKLRSSHKSDWQFVKAFTRLCRGQQRPFLLSTNRPDLVFDSTFTGGVKVKSSSTVGGGDYASWWVSTAHRRLAVTKADRTVQYVEVLTAPVDNGDGTLSLTLDQDLTGSVAKISFLELVRFARKAISVSWDGPVMSLDEPVVTVQDAVETASLHLFDKVITAAFAYSGIPPDVPPAHQTIAQALGKTSLVQLQQLTHGLSFAGLHATGGNVDGMVVCITDDSPSIHGMTIEHEGSTATATDRFWNASLTVVTGTFLAAWYRYNSAVGRWVELFRN